MWNKDIFKLALRKTLPVLAGYLLLGAGFGILAVAKGYNVL